MGKETMKWMIEAAGTLILALAAIALGLSLMNVRDNVVALAGALLILLTIFLAIGRGWALAKRLPAERGESE
jgi:hypothetical protein